MDSTSRSKRQSSRANGFEGCLSHDMLMSLCVDYAHGQWQLAAVGDGRKTSEIQSGHGSPDLSLQGRNILVVEDESLIALVLMDALEEAGANVIGPCYTLYECLRLARSENIDAAILDVDLAGQDVFPAADALRDRGIPFVFHTGHGEREQLKARFGDVQVCRKPSDMDTLLGALARAGGLKKSN